MAHPQVFLGPGPERHVPRRRRHRGLLAVEETTGTHQGSYWYFYDANGNVGQLVKGSDSSLPIAARYEYDAYGNALVATGTYAAANPFRFSTKWLDTETGLYYYGYRYYAPGSGRWLSADPLAGRVNHKTNLDLNLNAFCLNAPSVWIDYLGLQHVGPPGGDPPPSGPCYPKEEILRLPGPGTLVDENKIGPEHIEDLQFQKETSECESGFAWCTARRTTQYYRVPESFYHWYPVDRTVPGCEDKPDVLLPGPATGSYTIFSTSTMGPTVCICSCPIA